MSTCVHHLFFCFILLGVKVEFLNMLLCILLYLNKMLNTIIYLLSKGAIYVYKWDN